MSCGITGQGKPAGALAPRRLPGRPRIAKPPGENQQAGLTQPHKHGSIMDLD
ncbi:hypothetical protein PH210_01550 [Paenibacillus sp. BSR1-1]|uniref:hypothetical protein n=1 Tax=Paenibacillus sp. BSR1-1 TaxID=3020845 RepID=UPI0025B07FAB|nr:hypothetical protein [Paenibacillus sp. BSR1-1]MDN3014886.1 hypothetical protein [Paenibacillus sp. BSR1-1]